MKISYLCSLPSCHVKDQNFIVSSIAHQLKPPVLSLVTCLANSTAFSFIEE